MITQGKYKVIFNRNLGRDYFKMAIFAPRLVRQARPGQFVHLRCHTGIEPLLRRPFSFHRLSENSFEILYKVVGAGTNLLAKKQKGDKIDILGPLGNSFDSKSAVNHGRGDIILVAGGMGVAPLLAWAEELVYGEEKELYILIGARTKEHILCEKDFKRLKAKILVSTEDGSKGRKGLVTGCLKFLLSTLNSQASTIFACGPKPMLREVTCLSRRFRTPAYASLEENMACGVGACLGCAIKTEDGYRRVCRDGPIFNLRDIKWDGRQIKKEAVNEASY